MFFLVKAQKKDHAHPFREFFPAKICLCNSSFCSKLNISAPKKCMLCACTSVRLEVQNMFNYLRFVSEKISGKNSISQKEKSLQFFYKYEKVFDRHYSQKNERRIHISIVFIPRALKGNTQKNLQKK